MAALAKYTVQLEAETRRYKRGLDRANRQLGKFKKQQDRQLRAVSGAFARFLGPAVFVGAGISVVKLTDKFNKLTTRVKTATRDTGDFEEVMRGLSKLSVEVGSDFETTVSTFQDLARVADDLGVTNTTMLQLTKTVNQLGVIGGTSTKAMRDGLRQFNQAMAAGVFRAEEFNSIVENVPELAKRIADGLEVSQGQLRLMAIEGRLVSKEVMQVLLDQSADIGEQFKEIPADLERSFNSLGTALGLMFSKLDEATGFTAGLAELLADIAESLRRSLDPTPVEQLQEQLDGLIKRFQNVAAHLRGLEAGQYKGDIDAIRAEYELLAKQINTTVAAMGHFEGAAVSADLGAGGAGGAVPKGLEKALAGAISPIPFPPFVLNEKHLEEVKEFNQIISDAMAPIPFPPHLFDEMNQGFDAQRERQREAFVDLFGQNMVQAAEGGFDEVLKAWARTLQQMVAKALASKLFDLLAQNSKEGGFIQGALSVFGGAKAQGGPVTSGRAFLVGERGPELFVPPSSGNIVPNGVGGDVLNFNIDARGAGPGVELQIRDSVIEAVAIARQDREDSEFRGR